MRFVTALIVYLFVAALPPALAADPSQPPAATTAAPSSNVSPAPSAAGTVAPAAPAPPAQAAPGKVEVPPSASDAKGTAPKQVDPQQAARLRAMGYKPTMVNGRTMFCRQEQELGSRVASKVCANAEDVDRATQSSKEVTRSVQQNSMQPTVK
jgi:hypothetical protein